MNDLSQQIGELPPEKLGRLIAQLKKTRKSGYQKQRITRNGESKFWPLSSGQRRLWFLDQLQPGTAVYNTFALFRLTGPLKVAAWEQSLSEIRRRHEILRVTFSSIDGQPVQTISPPQPLCPEQVDLTELPDDSRESVAQQLAVKETHRPFDLTQGPLIRIKLLQLGPEERLVLFTIHHIIFDGWSNGPLIQELAPLYKAFIHGLPSPLAPLPVQYVDYVQWQQQWLQDETFKAQLEYWKQQMRGAPAKLELPLSHPRPTKPTYQGALHSFVVHRPIVAALNSIANRAGATLFMTLLAAVKVLLARYSGQADICVGSPFANRNRADVEGLIGFFVNTLVMRSKLGANPSFFDLLRQVRQVAVEAYAHQDVPFEYLVEVLQPERNLTHTPLFHVMVTLQNTPAGNQPLEGLMIGPWEIDSQTAKFDLYFIMKETDEGLTVAIQYSTDLFDQPTIKRLGHHFTNLLRDIAADPQQQISRFQLLSEHERQQLLLEWNDTQRPYAREHSLPQLFAAQVQRTPDAVAVVYDTEQLSYAELDQRSNQLAQHLRRLGLGLEDRVALCLPRSLEMVVGLLGILKVGAAYVPLDPQYPSERLSFMLADAGVSALLTTAALVERLPQTDVPLVRLDADWPLIARESTSAPAVEVDPQNLVYVIYTSGSTGRPKGVAVQHRNVSRLVLGQTYANFTDEVFLQLAPLSFDAATLELWAPLLHGSRLVLQVAGAAELEELGSALARHQVTTLWLTAGLFQVLVRERVEALRGVRQLLAGGEALPVAVTERAERELAGTQLINGYGPTEVTTFSCCHRLASWEAPRQSIPIGRALSNTSTYLLDEWQQPVGVGIEGELYLGGDGLARGYLGRAELTAERFVPDPFSASGGARLYRTGDICRWRWDGALEFSGRRDEQVKVRGYRIELGEIEVVLGRHEAVAAAAVVVRQEREGEQQLVGYLVWKDGAEVTEVGEVRRWLREQVPDYMVPGMLVAVEGLPLTENGKVDRRQLAAWATERVGVESGGEYLEPRTAVEELVAGIWAQVLGVERVGRSDNFFDLGGHSLLATQVVARVRKEFQLELPLQAVFEATTLEELASQISMLKSSQQGTKEKIREVLAAVGTLTDEEALALLKARG
jgi:amino acid adenylation domain-containing protein